MNRQQARQRVETIITGLNVFAHVYPYAKRTLDGTSPIALILGKGSQVQRLTRDTTHDEAIHALSLTIFVRCDEGKEAEAEDTTDQLVESVQIALDQAGFLIGLSDSAPEGNPLRVIDGVFYRQEVLPITYEEYI